jgi:hypothetical protein
MSIFDASKILPSTPLNPAAATPSFYPFVYVARKDHLYDRYHFRVSHPHSFDKGILLAELIEHPGYVFSTAMHYDGKGGGQQFRDTLTEFLQ